MKPTNLLWCATIVAACANLATPSSAENTQLETARQLLDSEPDRAVDAAEAVLAQNPELRAARLLAGEGSLRMARSGKFGRADLHLQDAARQFELGLRGCGEQEEPAARLMLAECQQELGEFATASKLAAEAAEGFQAQRTAAGRRRTAEALLLAGNCDYRRFAEARQAELDAADEATGPRVPPSRATAELALLAAGRFEAARREFPAEASSRLANIHQFLGQDSEVVRELERGLRDAPEATSLHDAYIEWMQRIGQHDALVGAYAGFVRAAPTLSILRWHQGRAVYARADHFRRQGNYQGAIAAYGKARELFGEYTVQVPAHADTANQWRALCDLAVAGTAVDMGDLVTAQAKLLAAAETSPLTTTYVDDAPQLYDTFKGHFTGTMFAIHRALADSGEGALAKTLAFNEAVLDRFPDRWGFAYNNAALAARDLGVQVANQGDPAAAKALWERSYAHYEKAVALMPEDARITNDCGLMLIYHLDRDFDRARQLFDRAIELGMAQLAAMPAQAAARERELLEEAVGDAYQNIAVLLREQLRQPFEAYRPFCEQAIKYFPYQRREAAAMLRTNGTAELASTARAALATRLSTPQGGAAEALAKVADAIKAKVEAEDFDGALNLLDGIVKDCKDHAPFHAQRGNITLKLANQARDAGRKGVDLFYQDAVSALKRAVELDPEPFAPRHMLAEAQYSANDLEGSARTLAGLLLHLQSQGGGKAEELQMTHLLRANVTARAYARKKADGQDDKELLTAARASFRLLEEKGQLDRPLLQLWSATEQWAGTAAEAVNVFVRAAQRAPDDLTLLDGVVTTAAAQSQLPLAVEALAKRNDAGAFWYLGKARYLLADAERQTGRTAAALQALDAARESFTASMTKNVEYRDSSEQWIAMCLGKKGNIAYQSNDFANAETWLIESARLRPDRINEDLGLAETTRFAILLVGDHHRKADDLAKAERVFRAASDAANSDVDLLNNAGLFARDHGVELERQGKIKEATALYEQSYKAYRRALQIDPQSVRLRNDCALIAVHHLERDWDLAKAWLDTAIADGQKMLAEAPPSDADERQRLDEAVGDSFENLALWHIKHTKDGKLAKAAAEASQKHFPGAGRNGAQRHLRAAERLLQGK